MLKELKVVKGLKEFKVSKALKEFKELKVFKALTQIPVPNLLLVLDYSLFMMMSQTLLP